MNDDLILVPRALLAALVTPTTNGFAFYLCAQEGRPTRCSYCEAEYEGVPNLDGYAHVDDCPVLLAQAVLAETATEDDSNS